MNPLLNLIDTITEELQAHPFVNTVSYGDIFQVELDKHTTYPLAHFIVTSINYVGSTMEVNINLIVAGLSKDDKETYVLAETLTVPNKLFEVLRRGDLRDERYHLDTQPVLTPFKDSGVHGTIGWQTDFTVAIPNEMGNGSETS